MTASKDGKVGIETLILYASETGNCEQISEDLFEEIKSNSENDGFFHNIKRYKLNQMKDKTKPKQDGYDLFDKSSIKLCVIICSSTGSGDMPENGEAFFRMLRRKTNLLAEN